MADSAAVPPFDRMEAAWGSVRFRRASGSVLVAAFFLALLAVEAARRGWLPQTLASALPDSHFAAVVHRRVAEEENGAASVPGRPEAAEGRTATAAE